MPAAQALCAATRRRLQCQIGENAAMTATPCTEAGFAEPLLCLAVVEQIADAVIFADREGVIRIWNRAAETLFGFSAIEVVGRSLDIIVPERFRQAHWAGFHRAIESGKTTGAGAVRTTKATHKAGHTFYVDLSFGLVRDASGVVIGSTAMGRDCTARFNAEKELRARLAKFETKGI
ncbi:MAG: PAS domain S-box protein [Caldimonas sp.]